MNILITGASRGIGKAITTHLLRYGHSVLGIGKQQHYLSELEKIVPAKDKHCLTTMQLDLNSSH